MEVEWDPLKNEQNVAKHGVPFVFAARAFAARMLQWRDVRVDYRETRWVGLTELEERVYVVVWTMRGPGRYRLISARKANDREKKRFLEQVSSITSFPGGTHEP